MAPTTVSASLANAFRSERLVYRTVENSDEDKKLIEELESDPVDIALASPGLVKPRGRKNSEYVVDQLSKSLLGVIICLPPGTEVEKGRFSGELTRIGYVVLGWGPPGPNTHHRNTSIGITLAPPYQDKGYGSEAINWALDWAFRFGGMHRVSIGTVSFNTRAQHLYPKLGFVQEGRSRESHWHDRKWHDMISYSMLESEWAALRGVGPE